MKIMVTSAGISLQEPDVFTALSVESSVSDMALVELGPWGELDGSHVWLDISHLESELSSALDADAHTKDQWRKDFANMVSYARKSGWVTPDGGKVRAHVEYL